MRPTPAWMRSERQSTLRTPQASGGALPSIALLPYHLRHPRAWTEARLLSGEIKVSVCYTHRITSSVTYREITDGIPYRLREVLTILRRLFDRLAEKLIQDLFRYWRRRKTQLDDDRV